MLLPILLAVLMAATASAQSTIAPDQPGQGPNARATQRPLGPNARAAQRPVGPNGALAQKAGGDQPAYYPTCAQAGTVRSTPLRRGEPGYGRHLDPDGDGVACD